METARRSREATSSLFEIPLWQTWCLGDLTCRKPFAKQTVRRPAPWRCLVAEKTGRCSVSERIHHMPETMSLSHGIVPKAAACCTSGGPTSCHSLRAQHRKSDDRDLNRYCWDTFVRLEIERINLCSLILTPPNNKYGDLFLLLEWFCNRVSLILKQKPS